MAVPFEENVSVGRFTDGCTRVRTAPNECKGCPFLVFGTGYDRCSVADCPSIELGRVPCCLPGKIVLARRLGQVIDELFTELADRIVQEHCGHAEPI